MSGLDDTQWSTDVKCRSCCNPLPGRWREERHLQCPHCDAEGYVTQSYDGTWSNAERQDDEELSMFQWIERAKTAEAKLEALKTADAHRTVALNGACFVISVLAGERYDHGLGDNYSEEIVNDARKRLEDADG